MNASPATLTATPRISVVVCTYNRARFLSVCLESLSSQTLSPELFEVVVVDDGSTDSTPAVCSAFQSRLPRYQPIRQVNAGLGAARDRGWRAASAPVVAFLDDDAEAPKDWLALALERFKSNAGRADAPAVLGGPARGRWETLRPAWLDDRLAAWLTVWEPFAEYRESRDEHLFVGANMFFLRSALESIGGFDPRLGRRQGSLLSHEESELWTRLSASGAVAAHDPALWVWHHVPAARCRRRWFLRRVHWEGVSMELRAHPHGRAARPALALRLVLRALVPPMRTANLFAWCMNLAYQCGRARVLIRRPSAA